MLEVRTLPIPRIRVPVKRLKTLEPGRVASLSESILEEGQKTPIRVRADGDGYILIEGLHRIEALKALGEETVEGFVVRSQQH
ncbi:ParB N-terminal domain-containing protein [Roseitranquillus sediminis]|uniref:ParB N-terminal domain-containing protein n=1 Tax=Roseitranquillus sediminis TaxID=2809051 RepID=UPI001D0C1BCB|nr:ParB N-terminal domain-containing protein [Roseitranquillus sediminis]MBM9595263.1 ParB N-terminal domain-containing protein [Roseitranquillus sediminis]